MEGFSFDVGTHGRVTGAIHRAADPLEATLVLAHGAGAPRTHPFMVEIASRISGAGVDVVTFNFLYAEAGRRMPDRVELLEACWRAAIATVRARGGLPTERLFIGGKSMGGRIAARIAGVEEGLVLAGLVLLGYPLHPPGKPRLVREELLGVKIPALVVQGTRDTLGTADEVKRVLARRPARSPEVELHVVRGGDHSLAVPRTEGPEAQAAALDAVAAAVARFVRSRAGKGTAPRRRKR
jgi:hypothetical protein